MTQELKSFSSDSDSTLVVFHNQRDTGKKTTILSAVCNNLVIAHLSLEPKAKRSPLDTSRLIIPVVILMDTVLSYSRSYLIIMLSLNISLGQLILVTAVACYYARYTHLLYMQLWFALHCIHNTVGLTQFHCCFYWGLLHELQKPEN